MEINRFNIDYHIDGMSATDKSNQKNFGGIYSVGVEALVTKSQLALQNLMTDDVKELLKNKSVAMLHLDKISTLIGKYHPDSVEAKKFMGGTNTAASMELIRSLEGLLNNSNLSKNEIEHIKNWIARELSCFSIALIFDGWGVVNKKLVDMGTIKGQPIPDTIEKIEPLPHEVQILTSAIAYEMKCMQPGDQFIMPAGSSLHIVRLKINKNEDGTFDLYYFNTGKGAPKIDGQESSVSRYASIPAKKLESVAFWEKCVEAKMQPSMVYLNYLLSTLSEQKDIDKWLKKPMQESGSCSYHAIEAEFKYSYISSFPTAEEGWNSYKKCTALMASHAVKSESSLLEPSIAKMLMMKQKIRQRYLDWLTVIDNPIKLSELKNAYIEAIVSLGAYSEEECRSSIDKMPPLKALSFLDKRLNQCLDYVSYEKLIQTRNTFGSKFSDFNHIGQKQLIWLHSTNQLFKDILEFSGWKGMAALHIRNLSASYFPKSWDASIQTILNFPYREPGTLKALWTEYLLRENPSIAENVHLNESLHVWTLFRHAKKSKSDPIRVMELVNKIPAGATSYDLGEFCQLLVEIGKVSEALKLVDKISYLEQQDRVLGDISVIAAKGGNVDDALKIADKIQVTESINNALGRMLENMDNFDDAIKIIDKISDPQQKSDSFQASVAKINQKNELTKAINFVDNISSEQRDDCLVAIVSNFLSFGDFDEAIRIIEKIDHVRKKSFALDLTIEKISNKDDLAKIVKYVSTMDDKVKDRTFANLASKFLESGNIDFAVEAADSIMAPYEKFDAFKRIAWEIVKTGDRARAKEMIDKAIEIKETIPSDKTKDIAAYSIVSMLRSIGDTDMALVHAKTLADDYKADTLLELSESLAELDKIDDLLEAINTITPVSEKNKTLDKVVEKLVAKNFLKEAKIAASAIEDEQLKENALQKIVNK